jgi:signal transduction histidine kinase
MQAVVRNPEWKAVSAKLILLHILFSICIFLLINGQLERINQAIVQQNAAFVGKVLKTEPLLEQEVVHYITQGADEKELALGKEVLSRYGYSNRMEIGDQPAFAGITTLPLSIALLVFLLVIPILMLVFFEYRRLFLKVRNIAYAADQVVEGKLDKPLPEMEEGDFSALGHSFNRMANRLNDSVEQLKQEKQFLGNLLTDISHQLKTPLASLIVFNENMLHAPDMNAQWRSTFLERSKQQLERMEWLIISMLKLARVEAGAIAYRKQKIKPLEIVEDTVRSLSYLSERNKQTIHIHGGENMVMQADEEWLSEAIHNLTKNALEHSPRMGEVHITLEENPLFYSIAIRDEGEGISPEELPHVFTRFYKGRSNTKPNSIGIGLSLTKSIIEGQSGTISVVSQLGHGSEFRMTFIKPEHA